MRRLHRCVLACIAGVLAVAGLSACSGGGGGSEPTSPPVAAERPFKALSCSGGDGSGWCWQRPQPEGFDTHDLHFIDASSGWAVAEGGRLLSTTDGGRSWGLLVNDPALDLRRVAFADARNGWAISPTAVYRSTDGGRIWSAAARLPLDATPNTLRISGQQGLVVEGRYLNGRFSLPIVILSDDGGASWRTTSATLSVSEVQEDGVLWSGVRQSLDGGRTFPVPAAWPGFMQGELGPTYPLGRARSAGRQVWAPLAEVQLVTDAQGVNRILRSQPTIARSEDHGRTWRYQAMNMPTELTASGSYQVDFFAGGVGWAVLDLKGASNWLWRSTDWGQSWVAVTGALRPASEQPVMPAFIDGNTAAYTSPFDGTTRITTDAGITWRSTPVNASGFERDRSGALLARWTSTARSTDNGLSWSSVPGGLDLEGDITGLWFGDALKGLALAADGSLLGTADGGLRWAPQQRLGGRSNGAGSLHGAGGVLWLVDSDGRLRQSTDAGRSWNPVSVGSAPAGRVLSARFFDARLGLVTAADCVQPDDPATCTTWQHATRDGGVTWQRRSQALGAGSFFFADMDQGVRFDGNGGPPQSTRNGGATWELSSAPSEAATMSRVHWSPDGTAWMWRQRVDGGPGAGLVLRSSDGGRSWQRAATLGVTTATPAGVSVQDLLFVDARRGWAVGHGGSVFATVDGGTTWQQQPVKTSKTLTTLHALDDSRVWMGGERGMIFASSTGGR